MIPCPRCGGCLPYEGPPLEVCRCGAAWEADLRELIAILARLTDENTPDTRPTREGCDG